MKILNYYIISFILKLHKSKSIDNKETALWGVLVLLDSYVALFILIPLIDLIVGFEISDSMTNRDKATALGIPLIVFNLFYFFLGYKMVEII